MRVWVVRPATGESGRPDGSYSPEEIRGGMRWVVIEILRGKREPLHGDDDAVHAFLRQAAGRYSILHRMVQMNRGDVVFVPRMPDDRSFVVARVAGPGYEFEDRSGQPATWRRDFGHIRRVRDVRVYPYAPDTLLPGQFGAPYLHAVDPVSARQQVFARFLRAHCGG